MYQALYRVWRPKTFSEMVGQESIRRTLRNQVKTGRIGHAYLFCGSRGTGKTSAAKIMARAINCLDPRDGDPCGECESCKMLLNDASFDVYEMDAASNSRVEEIRELLEKVDYPPQFGKYKVYIIDEVHMLSNAAFNALLKTLEEPPAYMVFILATTEPQKLPATILSRCQRFDFGRLTEDQIVSRLKEAVTGAGTTAEEDALYLIAQAAEGGMRDAFSILDMCLGAGGEVTSPVVREALGAADKGFLFDFAQSIADCDSAQALKNCDRLLREGRDVTVFLKDFSAHLRHLMAAKLCGPDVSLLGGSAESAKRYAAQSEAFSQEKLLRLLNLSMKAEADTRWATSARSVLEIFALLGCEKADSDDVPALLERIAALEARLEKLESGAVRIPAAKSEKKAPEAPAHSDSASKAVSDDAPASAGSSSPKDIWNSALKDLKKNAPGIYAPLSQGTYAGYENGVFRLSFPDSGKIFVTMLSTPERKQAVEDALHRAGGDSATFEAIGQKVQPDVQREKMIEQNQQSLIDTFGRDKVQIEGN